MTEKEHCSICHNERYTEVKRKEGRVTWDCIVCGSSNWRMEPFQHETGSIERSETPTHEQWDLLRDLLNEFDGKEGPYLIGPELQKGIKIMHDEWTDPET